jgi:tRNA (cytidine/uridine-2'-O-)-methyltransferase
MEGYRERQATYGRNGASRSSGLVVALWQPERPHNAGALLRLCACLDVALDIIEPAAFPLDERRVREAALDYGRHARWQRFADGASFLAARRREGRRLVLLSTAGRTAYHRAAFRDDDVLLLGNERRGVPPDVQESADLIVRIPMAPDRRALNVATAGSIVLAEALRQTGWLDRLAELQKR